MRPTWPFGIPYWLWIIVIVAVVAFVGNAIHFWTIKVAFSIP